MLVWLTRFYLSFNALLVECHKYFHLAWENNHAVSAKQKSHAKMFTEYMTIVRCGLHWISMNCKLRNFLTSACFLRTLWNWINPKWTKLFQWYFAEMGATHLYTSCAQKINITMLFKQSEDVSHTVNDLISTQGTYLKQCLLIREGCLFQSSQK